jgi:hypothetical protein
MRHSERVWVKQEAKDASPKDTGIIRDHRSRSVSLMARERVLAGFCALFSGLLSGLAPAVAP